jgi:hypothetical protein
MTRPFSPLCRVSNVGTQIREDMCRTLNLISFTPVYQWIKQHFTLITKKWRNIIAIECEMLFNPLINWSKRNKIQCPLSEEK